MKIKVFDIETLELMFYYLDYDIITKEFKEFEISPRRNDISTMVKYLVDRDFDYLVGFNSLNFDSQVITYIVENSPNWANLSGSEIASKISEFSSKVIDDTNHGLRPKYWENDLICPTIDLFKIHHYDNDSRRVGLKWLQYMMNWENLEEMPYHHKDKSLSSKQLDEIKEYCKNDVLSTYEFYKYTIGEVEHESYKGKNKIQDRLDLIDEGLLGTEVLNYSDSKIGDELNKKSYCNLTGKSPKDVYELKKKRGPTKSFTFGDAIPKYVKFKTKELEEFYNKVKKIKVSLKPGKTADQEFLVNFRGTESSIARGGIHSTEKNRIIEPKEDEILRDADVGLKLRPN